MNRQRKVLVTVTYNELGVIVDTETEELDSSAKTEPCEYYALCRHGRDESKLRARLKFCEYCNEDSDGYVKPLEKNNHAFVRFGMNGWEIDISAKGWHGSAKIRYCPMCGRKLMREGARDGIAEEAEEKV